jgi:hypothetical protein
MSKVGPSSHLGEYTYIPALFGSLITSNLLQSIGTGINLSWVLNGGVSSGTLCSAQGVPVALLLRECILAFSPPHHHVGGLKQAGNVGTAVWWAMNFYGGGAFADPRFAGRLPSLYTPSASCSCGPVSQSESSGLHLPWGGSSLFLSSLSALLRFRGKTEVPTLDPQGPGMSRYCPMSMQSCLLIYIEGAGSHTTTLSNRLPLNMQL